MIHPEKTEPPPVADVRRCFACVLAATLAQKAHDLLAALAVPRAGFDRTQRDGRVEHPLQSVEITSRPGG